MDEQAAQATRTTALLVSGVMNTDLTDDAFRQELLELFTLEAREWLQQAQAALEELRHQPEGQVNPKLIDVIQQGMSNFGGSAATVELPDLEQMAYGILPVLASLRRQAISPFQACAEMSQRMEDLASALGKVSGTKEGTTPPPDATPTQQTFTLENLRQLQLRLTETEPSGRNLMELVIQRISEGNGQAHVSLTVSTVTQILREVEGLDEQFLAEMQRHVPQVTEAVAFLKAHSGEPAGLAGDLASVIESVRGLEQTATTTQAPTIAQFFRGLGSFLTVASQGRLSLVAERLPAVEFRLGAVIPMAHQWVEMGRAERSAIVTLMSA